MESKLKVYENTDYVNVSKADNPDVLTIISGLCDEISLLKNIKKRLEIQLKVYKNDDREYDFEDFDSINIAVDTHLSEIMRLEEIMDKIHDEFEGYEDFEDFEDDDYDDMESLRERNSELSKKVKKLISWLSEFECNSKQQQSRLNTYKNSGDLLP